MATPPDPDPFKPGELTRRLQEQQREMQATFDHVASFQAEQRQRKDYQTQRGLELNAELVRQQKLMVESQQAMLAEQIRQAAESTRDRRIQYAVLTIAVLALVSAVVIPVAIATGSVVWTLVSGGGTALAASAAAWLIVRGRTNPST